MKLKLKPDAAVLKLCIRYGTGFGKHKYPDPENITQSTVLADFAGKDLWFTMNILQINDKFLADNVDTWPEFSAYLPSHSNVRAVNVVNDAAEHG